MVLAGNSAVEPDLASQLLIAELALNDIAAVQANRKGKARDNAPRADEEVAFNIQADSLNAFISVLRDRRFATSIDRAIESDASQLGRLTCLERAERDDHLTAVALGDGHDLPQQTEAQRTMEQIIARLSREQSLATQFGWRGHLNDTLKAKADMDANDPSMVQHARETSPVWSEWKQRPGDSSKAGTSTVNSSMAGETSYAYLGSVEKAKDKHDTRETSATRKVWRPRLSDAARAKKADTNSSHPNMVQPAGETFSAHSEWRARLRNTSDAGADMGTINLSMEKAHISTPASERVLKGFSSKPAEKSECVICTDAIVAPHPFKAPCGHLYCRGCIVNLVETSLRDETLHPLRCCHRPLSLLEVFSAIPISLWDRFLAKNCEFSVPAGSRVYCCNQRCSTFLGASGVTQRNITCSGCSTITCSQCRDAAHPGQNCAQHQLTQELCDMASANGWQTCPGCHAIVELTYGCYHITCRCSAQFCYLCSARWKTCTCQQWDDEQLLDDAERRVRNEFGDREAEARPRVHAERVQRRIAVLRENHECQEHFWRYRHGEGRCEECGDCLRVFLMRCIRCQALVCRRCSVNRL